MKIVLDTNVLISALIHDGKPRFLLSEILRRQELVISREILKEVAVVAEEERIKKYVSRRDVASFLRDISSSARITRIRSRFSVVEEDPDDDDLKDGVRRQGEVCCFRRWTPSRLGKFPQDQDSHCR
ncbi:MAG: putative toxin-antitoxin system toxin component, PIN family [Nitrososphaera sp.]|uniref:putative toxin-antitoxin system toxin component, PIN family n=1 Tax=Nitrososphaera sp. TaxID=1971748 RepID=UPI003D6E96CB